MLALGRAAAQDRDAHADPSRAPRQSPRRLLAKRARRVLDRGAVARLAERERHRLRIDLRKLRYLCEFLGGPYPMHAVRRYVRRIAALQEALGASNDLAVTGGLVRSLATELAASDRAAISRLWRHHAATRAPLLDAEVASAWRKFARDKPFWS
jgi:CHAD domain-containing protein